MSGRFATQPPHRLRPAFFDNVGRAFVEWEWGLVGTLLIACGFAEKKEGHSKDGENLSNYTTHSWRLIVVSKQTADTLLWAVPTFFTTAGLLSNDVGLWYWTLAETFAYLAVGCLGTCAVLQSVSIIVGSKIQAKKRFASNLVVQEAKETALSMYVIATFVVWPRVQAAQGYPTALVYDIKDGIPYSKEMGLSRTVCFALYLIKFTFIVLGADMWTYWKHRSLHSRILWVFHKSHHAYHDPTCFAGFALHPVEGLLTFAPILLFCNSNLGIYAPLHIAMLGFFSLLNFYLHCGHAVSVLEKWLPKFWVNTSLWHNRHHERTLNHYGEMLSLWGHLCGTIPAS